MKKSAWVLVGFLTAFFLWAQSAFAAPYGGKLDLSWKGFDAVCFRELNDGGWWIGGSKRLFYVERLSDNLEIIHLGFQYSSHLGGPGTAYGGVVGTNIGGAGSAILGQVQSIAALINDLPMWTKKISDWTSVDFFGGYAPNPGVDQHHWSYGIGGKVVVPFDQLQLWATGAAPNKGQKGL